MKHDWIPLAQVTPELWANGEDRGSKKEVAKFRRAIDSWPPQTSLRLGDAHRHAKSVLDQAYDRMLDAYMERLGIDGYEYHEVLFQKVCETDALFKAGRYLHAAHFVHVVIEFEEHELRRNISDHQYEAWCAGQRDDEQLLDLRDLHNIREALIACYKEKCARQLEVA